jgi:SAM-dependent methyltransferase
MAIRNIGAIVTDPLRCNYIKKSLQEAGNRKNLLDLGCGVKPYKYIYSTCVEKSVGIDVAHSPHALESVDIIYDGKNIPFPNREFDIVLCTEVMEHVPDPVHFLSEINRVLQPGGALIMTTPFIIPMHEQPYDFYRFTKHGIEHLLDSSGFEVKNITSFADILGVILILNVNIFITFWSWIAKVTRLKIVNSVWNPFIFVFAVVPQWVYLFYLKIPIPGRIREYLSRAPRGYGYYAVKK